MSFLVQDAYAETVATPAAQAGAGSELMGVVPFVFIFVVMYFLMIRPQQKKMKLHQAMVMAVKKGDKIVTSGGILGKVTQVNDNEGVLQVEIADGVKVKVLAATIASVVADKPVNDNVVVKKKKANNG